MSSIKYFVGKICTIITGPINRNFKDEAQAVGKPELYPMNLVDHFMGRVVSIDANSIVIQHPIIGTMGYFRLANIVGIIEEQELDPNNPEHAKAIEEYKEKQEKQIPSRGKTLCPNGHSLKIPENIPDGSEVICPACKAEFRLNVPKTELKLNIPKSLPESNSQFIDVDQLSKLAEDAPK